MDAVIGVLVVAVVVLLWGYSKFRTFDLYFSKRYSSKRQPPNLAGFRPTSGNAAPDKNPTQPKAAEPRIGDVSDPV